LSTSFLRGGLSLLATQPVTWGASLLVAVLVPHYLGDANLGKYAVAWTIAQIVGVLATCGVPSYITRRIAQEPGRIHEISSNALVMAVGLSIGIVAIGLVVAWPIVGYTDTVGILLALGLVWVLCTTPQQVLTALLMGQERHARYAWLGAGSLVVTTIASIGVLALGGGVLGYMAAGVLAAAGVTLFSWRTSHVKLALSKVRRGRMLEIARGGAPFLAWDLTLRVHSEIARVLLAILSRDAVVGWYAAAGRIIAIPLFIPTLITMPLLPALSRAQNLAQLQTALRHALAAVLLLTIPCSAIIAGVAPAVPDLFHWPLEFQHSIPLMMILALQQPLVGIDMVLGTALIAQHREHRWLQVFMLAAASNVALNALLIPLADHLWANGAIGSSIVSIVSESVMLAGALILLPRGTVGRESLYLAVRVILAGVALFAVTSTLLSISLPLAALAGGLTYAAAALLLRAVTISELIDISRIARQLIGARLGSAGQRS
jgi:O-antigen/teichoic acid export membrane protein